jgi:hypothetical protein
MPDTEPERETSKVHEQIQWPAGDVVVVVRNGTSVVLLLVDDVQYSSTLLKGVQCQEDCSNTIGSFRARQGNQQERSQNSHQHRQQRPLPKVTIDLSEFYDEIITISRSNEHKQHEVSVLDFAECKGGEHYSQDNCSDDEAHASPWVISCCNYQAASMTGTLLDVTDRVRYGFTRRVSVTLT